jgi:hypothetical protein
MMTTVRSTPSIVKLIITLAAMMANSGAPSSSMATRAMTIRSVIAWLPRGRAPDQYQRKDEKSRG